MAYKTIFDTKPKKENKNEFCKRLVRLLESIEFYSDHYVYNNGLKMLNIMFMNSKLNCGYANIDDLLSEADKPYANIFSLSDIPSVDIDDEEILVNIDIITNCIVSFKGSNDCDFNDNFKAKQTIEIIFKAIREYLLCCGYKLIYDDDENRFFIIENEIAIDLEEIDDNKMKQEVINFYDYRIANDLDEKKKILLVLIGNLESRKNIIEAILGSNIASTFSNYANNFNLRHNNIEPSYKKYFNSSIANITKDELLKWYDYIFAFMINIYLSLDKLKDVNINNGYK